MYSVFGDVCVYVCFIQVSYIQSVHVYVYQFGMCVVEVVYQSYVLLLG